MSSTTPSSCGSGATTGPAWKGRLTGSFNELTMQNGIPLTDENAAPALRALRRARPMGRCHHGPSLLGRMGVGRGYSVPVGQAGGFAPGRDPQPDGRALARPHQGGAAACASQFTHVIDVAPTILDVAGIPEPETVDGIEQEPMHGSSFSASLTDGAAPEHRTQQYFETVGNRAMYKDGWWLAMKTERIPWDLTPEALAPYAPGVWDPDAGPAELYYLPDDFSQAKDLAADHPEKVQELKDLFWQEAERYKVLPLLAALSAFFGIVPPIAARYDLRVPG